MLAVAVSLLWFASFMLAMAVSIAIVARMLSLPLSERPSRERSGPENGTREGEPRVTSASGKADRRLP